ncbi:unnamed protein product [Darwinula stevensoni]|uniref:Chitin-binding type-2 domain-containing protein n=1 Tax=Darwinula stevensoni TaxID=69355 RepID=A0A7R9AA34_9CRUS|nr:unnamed protein product [Darwinula stevensoni]CAG0897778.1 unnamed protein product [Darwinula stevensoni]
MGIFDEWKNLSFCNKDTRKFQIPGRVEERKPGGVANTGGRAFQCPEAEGRYPHESLCYMFYECVDYIPYDYECPDDELYSQEEQYCMPPGEVDCGNLLPRPTTSGQTQETTPGSGSSTPGGGDFQCPTSHGLYPHETFCYMFYNCVDYIPYPSECPEDKLFDQEELYCMPPEERADLLRRRRRIAPPPRVAENSNVLSLMDFSLILNRVIITTNALADSPFTK